MHADLAGPGAVIRQIDPYRLDAIRPRYRRALTAGGLYQPHGPGPSEASGQADLGQGPIWPDNREAGTRYSCVAR
jgi:hypothetical protein